MLRWHAESDSVQVPDACSAAYRVCREDASLKKVEFGGLSCRLVQSMRILVHLLAVLSHFDPQHCSKEQKSPKIVYRSLDQAGVSQLSCSV